MRVMACDIHQGTLSLRRCESVPPVVWSCMELLFVYACIVKTCRICRRNYTHGEILPRIRKVHTPSPTSSLQGTNLVSEYKIYSVINTRSG